MWIVSLLVPVTAIVQVGGGVLQGAQDFDYQVRKMEGATREERRESLGLFLHSKHGRLFIHNLSALGSSLILSLPPFRTYSQARVMGLCVLFSGGLLHLTTRRGGAGRGAGGQLLPVWLSLLVFQSLRALGFAWRFWKDPKCVYWGLHGGRDGTKNENEEHISALSRIKSHAYLPRSLPLGARSPPSPSTWWWSAPVLLSFRECARPSNSFNETMAWLVGK